jgi:hypothetical protein
MELRRIRDGLNAEIAKIAEKSDSTTEEQRTLRIESHSELSDLCVDRRRQSS